MNPLLVICLITLLCLWCPGHFMSVAVAVIRPALLFCHLCGRHCLPDLWWMTAAPVFTWNSISDQTCQVWKQIIQLGRHLSLIMPHWEFLSLPLWNFNILFCSLFMCKFCEDIFFQKTAFWLIHLQILSWQWTPLHYLSKLSRLISSNPHWLVNVVNSTIDFKRPLLCLLRYVSCLAS